MDRVGVSKNPNALRPVELQHEEGVDVSQNPSMLEPVKPLRVETTRGPVQASVVRCILCIYEESDSALPTR